MACAIASKITIARAKCVKRNAPCSSSLFRHAFAIPSDFAKDLAISQRLRGTDDGMSMFEEERARVEAHVRQLPGWAARWPSGA